MVASRSARALCRLVFFGTSSGVSIAGAQPTPPYDLGADLDTRRREALDDLGRAAAVDVVENVFVIAAPGGAQALASSRDLARRALRAYLDGRFGRRPNRAVSVYLFSDAGPYGAYCRRRWRAPCISQFGFYMNDERRIVMNVGPGIGTLTHELVHPLVAADFPDAPDWINEGIASLFEQPVLGPGGQIHGGKNWRHPRLLRIRQMNITFKRRRLDVQLQLLVQKIDKPVNEMVWGLVTLVNQRIFAVNYLVRHRHFSGFVTLSTLREGLPLQGTCNGLC